MTSITVWRLENPQTGKGPYNDLDRCLTHSQFCSTWDSPVGWYEDGLKHVADSSYVACCPTLDSLIEWFSSKWVNEFVKVGYEVVSYELDRALVEESISGRQCAAMVRLATKRTTHSVESILSVGVS